jgi:hypothetical protein
MAQTPDLTSLTDQLTRSLRPQMEHAQRLLAGMPSVVEMNRNISAVVASIGATNFPSFPVPTFDLGPLPDFSSFLPQLPDLLKTLKVATDAWWSVLPANWPRKLGERRLAQIVAIIQDEGLPMAWVPPVEVVEEMLGAIDRTERVEVLLANKQAILDGCRAVTAEVDLHMLAEQRPLVEDAIEALAAGHHRSAQALATVTTETMIGRHVDEAYHRVLKKVRIGSDDSLLQVRLLAALAPAGIFYVAWSPKSGKPAPEELSRHVVVHQAHKGHFTESNALIAVMLACSVLRGIGEKLVWEDEASPDETTEVAD